MPSATKLEMSLSKLLLHCSASTVANLVFVPDVVMRSASRG